MRSYLCLIVAIIALLSCITEIDANKKHPKPPPPPTECCCAANGFIEVLATLQNWSCLNDVIPFHFPLTVLWNDGSSSTIDFDWVITIKQGDFRARGTGLVSGTFAGFTGTIKLDLTDPTNGCDNGVGISEVSGSASLFIRSSSGGVYGAKGWRSCTGEATITFNPAIPAVEDITLPILDHSVLLFDQCVGPCLDSKVLV